MEKKNYKHLTFQDWVIIQACINDNKSVTEISRILNVNKSTISRELNKHSIDKKQHKLIDNYNHISNLVFSGHLLCLFNTFCVK